MRQLQALKAVWVYAGTLGVALGAIELIFIRSLQLLVPIGECALQAGSSEHS